MLARVSVKSTKNAPTLASDPVAADVASAPRVRVTHAQVAQTAFRPA